MPQGSSFDVVSIGETMLRFSPPGIERLEQAHQMDIHVGGSESNTLAGLVRLGGTACWLSRLTDHPLGRYIARSVASYGVDTTHLLWTNEDRVGIYFLENGVGARASQVVYDRARSAFSHWNAKDLPEEPIRRAKLLHLTGISLALGETTRGLLHAAQTIAKANGVRTSFDFNYRSKLWTMDEARSVCRVWLQTSDLVFIAYRDAVQFLELGESSGEESTFARLLHERPSGTTVMTLGEKGALANDGRRTLKVGSVPTEGPGRLGAGDAFSAGFITGWLRQWDLDRCLRWANAAARFKMSIPGDLPAFSLDEIQQLADHGEGGRLVR